MAESSKKLYSKKGTKEQDDKLLEPFNYTLQRPGKKIRTKLMEVFNFWLAIPQDKIVKIAHIIESLHNASLILDDIEDNSTLRRGLPVAHLLFSMKRSINSANYAVCTAMEICAELGQESMPIFTQQLLELHRGQGMEIYWRDNCICPTEDEYYLMAKRKTGGLFVMGINLMQLFSDKKYDFANLFENIGLYFQIKDDYINLTSEEYMEGKSICDDLSEGKFSFPLIHAVNRNTEVLKILRDRHKNDEMKKYCVQLMEACGSFEYTRMKLETLRSEIEKEINKIDRKNPLIELVLTALFN